MKSYFLLFFISHLILLNASHVKKRQVSIDFGGLLGGILGGNPNQGGQSHGQTPNPFQGLVGSFLGGFNQQFGGNCHINNGGCQHLCRVVRGQIRCLCNQGYQLHTDGRSCIQVTPLVTPAIQPVPLPPPPTVVTAAPLPAPTPVLPVGPQPTSCSINNGGCEQICKFKRRRNKVKCSCNPGFFLEVDQRSCTTIGAPGGGGGQTHCGINNGGCNHNCRDTINGPTCSCRRRYVLQPDGKTCIRKGQQPPPTTQQTGCNDNNGGCSQICASFGTTVFCQCHPGYVLQQDTKTCLIPGQPPPPIVTQNPCANNGGCQHICRPSVSQATCLCNPGYTLLSDGKSCIPAQVNPCQNNNGGCQQICNAVNGSPQCSCRPGFQLVNNQFCQTVTGPLPPQPPQPPINPGGPVNIKGCGKNDKKSLYRRIVGGRPSNPKDWPWMAALLTRNSQQYCGGTLISAQYVLTAAHCLKPFHQSQIRVRLGEYDFNSNNHNSRTDFGVQTMMLHENYDTQTQENDIAMLKLDRPTTFSEFIWPVCLPPPNDDFTDALGYVTGWGTTAFGGQTSNVLMEVIVPVWNQGDCDAAYPGKVKSTMMCAGKKEGGKDSCQGDSGGPYLTQINQDPIWYIAGVVSWGIECAKAGNPGVYTRVNKYLPWIQSKMA